MRIVGWTLIGVGAAGLATGIVAGAFGLGTKGSLEQSCDANGGCDPDQQGRLDRLKTEATVGTIGFIVGGVGLGGGAAILLLTPRNPAKASALRGFGVGLGSLGYRGSF